MKLTGNTILVTGAGTGMGLAAAKSFSRLGNRVVMVARNRERLEAEAARLPGALSFACDIADPDAASALVRWTEANAPDLNLVFLNAGIANTFRLFDGSDARAKAHNEMEVNFVSAVDLTHRFMPVIEKRQDPAIIVTTSGVVYGPDTKHPTYSATKAALHSYIQSMRFTLAKSNSPVRIFELVAPLVDSPFSAGVQSDAKATPEEVIDELVAALREDRLDVRAGTSQEVYEAWRRDEAEALQMVNSATGG